MAGLEIERKWLIARPDTAFLAALEGASAREITQTYLTAAGGEGISRRVRASRVIGAGDGERNEVVYTRTTKSRVDAMSSAEDEAVISAAEYVALLHEADPACAAIEKTRWRVPYAGQTLEIDIYPFWPERAVLEIELPARDTPVALPEWLRVLREVTGERAYSNHSLSRALQKGELPEA